MHILSLTQFKLSAGTKHSTLITEMTELACTVFV